MEGSYPGSSAAGGAAAEAPRPHSVMGCEQPQQLNTDAFAVYQDAQGTPPAGAEATASSSRSRRLSLSFGSGPRHTATVARNAAKVSI